MDNQKRNAQAQKTFRVTFIVNFFLMLFKLFAGIFGRSAAMISDAVHTLTDLGTTIIGMFGVRIASKDSDEGHPYGHEKIESVAGLFLAVILLIAAIGIGRSGIEKLIAGKNAAGTPGIIAIIAAATSIITQGTMYRYAKKTALKIESSALLADAYHHRSDELSSIGTLVGISMAACGIWFADALASLIICVLIIYAAYEIGRDCINQLIDAAPPEDDVAQIKASILSVDGVMHIDDFRSRLHGSKLYVDVEIAVNKNETFSSAHQICENVHGLLEADFPKIIHCTVHANPHEI